MERDINDVRERLGEDFPGWTDSDLRSFEQILEKYREQDTENEES